MDTIAPFYPEQDQPARHDDGAPMPPDAASSAPVPVPAPQDDATLRSGSLDAAWQLWYRLSGPPCLSHPTSAADRERARLAGVASAIILCTTLIALLALPVTSSPDGLLRISLLLAADGVALVLNRRGRVVAAGALLVASTEIGAVTSFLLSPNGTLGVMAISLYNLFLVPDIIAAALLPPVSVLALAGANCLFIALDALAQPHDAAMGGLLSRSAYIVIERPIAMQLFVAIVMYIWVRLALSASRRADDAEVVARLRQREVEFQRQEAERSRVLDEGAAHLQVILTQLANGNFHARVPVLRDPRLWQVGKGLNHFIGRLERFAQADFTLQREQQEAQRLVQAIYDLRAGHQPIWPAPSGTPLDTVIGALRGPLPGTGADERQPAGARSGRGATPHRPASGHDPSVPTTSASHPPVAKATPAPAASPMPAPGSPRPIATPPWLAATPRTSQPPQPPQSPHRPRTLKPPSLQPETV